MIKILLTILIVSSLFSCEENTKHIEGNADHYEQLILNVALTHPDYQCFKCESKNSYTFIKKLILPKIKEIRSNDLELRMTLHKWSYDGGQSFPKALIYVSNNKDFEYAFPFYDEYYYWRIYSNELKNLELIEELESKITFDKQLNYVISQLNLNKPENREELNHFITLLADSLLGLKRFTSDDTLMLERYLEKKLTDTTRITNSCMQKVKQNINHLMANLPDEDVLIYSCAEGRNAFWKFETTVNIKGNYRVKTTFENKECYFSIYY
tara:strand:- start:77 stop:880 length:804 start_codon:yes stop_codon:yes gene_type:complete